MQQVVAIGMKGFHPDHHGAVLRLKLWINVHSLGSSRFTHVVPSHMPSYFINAILAELFLLKPSP